MRQETGSVVCVNAEVKRVMGKRKKRKEKRHTAVTLLASKNCCKEAQITLVLYSQRPRFEDQLHFLSAMYVCPRTSSSV